ncbi:hypothetical protein ABZ611_21025 [Streptomyces sp. NPDC007861]|uniref:hypothetical protein n=1 Tax=Streptomyces sp. NPDC007861 TaxID=3154893 RepID=UPI0033CA48F3
MATKSPEYQPLREGQTFEEIKVGQGEQVFRLGIKPLPRAVQFDGFPGEDNNNTWNITEEQAIAVLTGAELWKPVLTSEFLKNPVAYMANHVVGPNGDLWPSVLRESGTVTIWHSKGTDAGILWSYGVSKKHLSQYLEDKGSEYGGFVGALTEIAPYVGKGFSGQYPGPTTLTTKVSIIESSTRTNTTGWSVGGSIKATAGLLGKSADFTGTFSYSNSRTDSQTYGVSSEESYPVAIPEGKWGWVETRFQGGVYTGHLYVIYKPGDIVVSQNGLKYFTDQKISYRSTMGTTMTGGDYSDRWCNAVTVVEMFPFSAGVKCPGSVPAITRFLVTVDNGNTKAKRSLRDISNLYEQATLKETGQVVLSSEQSEELETLREELRVNCEESGATLTVIAADPE